MHEMKKKSEETYSLFFIPEDSREVRKLSLTKSHLKTLIGAGLALFLFLVFSVVGFWYYRSLYSSAQKDQVRFSAYEKERQDLINKVSSLEQTVGETEKMAGKLASLIGPERMNLQKGIGPIPDSNFDIEARTAGLTVADIDPKVDRVSDRAVTLQEKIKELTLLQEAKVAFLSSTPTIWPVRGWVTSDFGYRRSPFTLASDFHPGIDIAASWGTPIVAPADGVVTFSGFKNGYGQMVAIDHGFGVMTRYGHTSQLLVHEGEKIKRGAKIALVGSTGHSTGPHLHYEIHVDNVAVDPMKYILKD